MGHVMHDFLLATTFQSDEALAKPLDDIIGEYREQMPEQWRSLLVGPVESVINHDRSVVLMPDGSKTGWDTDEEGNSLRDALVAHLRQHIPYVHICIARYGDSAADISDLGYGYDEEDD